MAGAEERRCMSVADGLRGQANGRARLPTQGRRSRLRHVDVFRRVEDVDVERRGTRVACEFSLDKGAVSREQQPDLQMPRGDECPIDDGAGAVIAAHGVDGDAQLTPLRRP